MLSKLRAGIPYIALAFVIVTVFFVASCRTDQVEVPTLTGPSGARLFLTMEAAPDKVFIKRANQIAPISRITVQLKDQLGHPVPNETIAFRIINAEGSEVAIGTLDARTRATDSGGYARVTYTAPSAEFQPVPTIVYIYAVMTNPAYTFEVTARQKLDLELARPFDCVSGPGAPVISFSANPNPPVLNQLTCFDAQSTSGANTIISFSWTFGDGGTASGATACHTFKRKGPVSVTLTVVDANQNCSTVTEFFNIGEGGSPQCTFSASPNPVSTDTIVNFDASASQDPDGTIRSFRWDFGDGTTGNGEKTTHMWGVTGSFTVTLTVTDDAGNETVCTQTITVASGVPSCSFTITPNPADVDETVVLDGSASTDPEGGTLSFAWDLDNDGQFDDATGQVTSTSYSSSGTKLINLQVTDPENNQVVCTNTLDIGNRSPLCESFTASPSANITPGGTITFDVTASDPDTTDTLSVKFTTTGGSPGGSVDTTAPFQQANTTYSTAGTFTATAVVSDNHGGSDTCAPITVTVGNTLPLCSFTNTAPSGSAPFANQTVDFNSTSTDSDGTIASCSWDFGDGGSDNVCDPTPHQFAAAGPPDSPFTVTLTVTDNNGGQSSCPKQIVIDGGNPLCSFTFNQPATSFIVNFDAGASVDTDENATSIANYNWDFGDGNTSATNATANKSHDYTTAGAGTYTVHLTVTDDEGKSTACTPQDVTVPSP